MPGKGKEIDTQLLHIDLHVRGTLRPVHKDDRALLMRERRNLLHGIDNSEHIRHLRDGDELCPLGDLLCYAFQIQMSVRRALYKFQYSAGLSRQHLPREKVAVMLHDGDKDFIPRLQPVQSVAVGDQIDTLRRIPREDDLLRRLRV